MNNIQYMTQTLFGEPSNDLQNLTDEQQGEVLVLQDLANALMTTRGITFPEAVDLANKKLPEEYVVNTELGFQLEMAKKESNDPMVIIKTVREHVLQDLKGTYR